MLKTIITTVTAFLILVIIVTVMFLYDITWDYTPSKIATASLQAPCHLVLKLPKLLANC